MEKQPALALKEMAMTTYVAHLWSQRDVLALIIEVFPFEENHFQTELWYETGEAKVQEKISKLFLPEVLKRRISLLVRPIGLQIPKWMSFMAQCLMSNPETDLFNEKIEYTEKMNMNILKHLCWTSTGSIDYSKTAEKLVNLKTLDIVQRFKIASGHCLVDFLPKIWKKLPQEFKSGFLQQPFNSQVMNLYGHSLLQFYWAYVLNGEYELLETRGHFYNYALRVSIQRGYLEATRYFLQRLGNEERESVLYSTFKFEIQTIIGKVKSWDFASERCADVLCYLFSLMAPEVQMQVLRKHPSCPFLIFLHWPSQVLFLDATDLVWNFPPEERTYKDLLRQIERKIYFSADYFPDLLQEFFRRSPKDFRKYFANRESKRAILFPGFLYKEDEETVEVILKNMDAEDRFRLVSSFDVFQSLDFHLGRKEDLVELCVREACSSKEEREILKEVYMEWLAQNKEEEMLRKSEWELFFQSLDEADANAPNARSLEDETAGTEKERKALKRKRH